MSEEKNLVGRPTKYDPKFVQDCIEYFDVPLREIKQREVATSSGRVAVINEEEPVDFPSIAGFAAQCGVAKKTVYEWAKKYPEFSNALDQARAKQEHILAVLSLKGDYHAGIAKFFLINNHDYREKIEHDHNVSDIKINIDDEDARL